MYNIFLIHTSGDSRADTLRAALDNEVQRFDAVIDYPEWSQISTAVTLPTTAVYLGNQEAPLDPLCEQRLATALQFNLPIIPFYLGEHPHSDQVPEELRLIKAIPWTDLEQAPQDGLTSILETLGIVEKDRKVFISYRWSDGRYIAYELFHALVKRRFSVFLDVVQVTTPENVQDRIRESIEDTSFVLLLHSPDMPNSDWVQREITQALNSQIPICRLKWTTANSVLPEIDELPTFDMDPADLEANHNHLGQQKLNELIRWIERHHAEGLYRRRRDQLVAATQFAKADGWDVVEDTHWRLILTRQSSSPTLLGVTPRLARAEDLYTVGTVVTPLLPLVGAQAQWRRILLQASEYDGNRTLLAWIIDHRPVTVCLGIQALTRCLGAT